MLKQIFTESVINIDTHEVWHREQLYLDESVSSSRMSSTDFPISFWNSTAPRWAPTVAAPWALPSFPSISRWRSRAKWSSSGVGVRQTGDVDPVRAAREPCPTARQKSLPAFHAFHTSIT